MKKLSGLVLLTGLAASTALAQFTPGNVVVLQCTNTSGGGGGTLVEFNRVSGATGYQVTLPFSTTDSGSSIVFGNSSTLNHDITLSGDGAFVVVPGYAAPVSSVDSAIGPHVIAMVKYDGTYSRPISYVNAWSFRGATADGFGHYWGMTGTAGTGGTDIGLPHWGLGGYAVVQGTVGRAVGMAYGNLYYTLGGGLYAYEGAPTTSVGPGNQIIANTAMSASATPSSFALPPSQVVGAIAYMVDYNSTAAGIGHFHWDGSSWVWDYNLPFQTLTTKKPQHIAVDYSTPATPVVYVTPAQGSANSLYYIVDTSAAATATILATAPSGNTFRGLAMAPVQPAAPVITADPASVTNFYGATVSFTVTATNANPNGYTWTRYGTNLVNGQTRTNGPIISGATSSTLTVEGIGKDDETFYYAVAHNNGTNTATSAGAFLKLKASCISPQLVPATVAAGGTAQFTGGTSSCQAPLTFSWTWNNSPISDGWGPSGQSTYAGTTTGTLWISNAYGADMGTYTLTVIDGNGDPSISIATLIVASRPSIDPQPVNQSKIGGQTASFSIGATGGALSYQWYYNAAVINDGPTGTGSIRAGTQTPTLWITNVSSADVGTYTCTVANVAGTATSDPATLSVGYLPVITVPPVSLVVTAGQTAVFAATVTGSDPITYSWKHNADTLSEDGHHSGTGTDTLTITDVQVADAQSYTITASNDYGSANATAVLRFVTALPKPHTVPGLVLYETFDYPASWQDIISTWNEATGEPAYWQKLGGANSAIEDTEYVYGLSKTGQYPWRGLDCSVTKEWYSSSAPNNNHLNFGGIDQTNGRVYFSCVLQISQSSALADDKYDVIAGLTTGTGSANADNWIFKLCTHNSNGGDGYQLGIFKGGGSSIDVSSVNGQWTEAYLGRGPVHFIVGCYKFNSGTNRVSGSLTNDDVLSLWIDPDRSSFGAPAESVPAPTLGGSVTNWGVNAPITEFAIKGLVPPTSRRYADLRIGTTWASVTPPHYPTIEYTYDGANLTLAWPAKDSGNLHSSGYKLEESADLLTWHDNLDSPHLDGSQAKVTVSAGTGPFYRLKY